MTHFELICLGCLFIAVFCGVSWIMEKIEVTKYLSDEEIEQRIREVNKALENRPRVRAITEIKGK